LRKEKIAKLLAPFIDGNNVHKPGLNQNTHCSNLGMKKKKGKKIESGLNLAKRGKTFGLRKSI